MNDKRTVQRSNTGAARSRTPAFLVTLVFAGSAAFTWILIHNFASPDTHPSRAPETDVSEVTRERELPAMGSVEPVRREPTPVPSVSSAGEETISEIILNERITMSQAAGQLLYLLPSLDEDLQEEAASHVANLSDDDDAKLWVSQLVEGRLPPPAAEVFFNELINRSDTLKYPALSAIADDKNHPMNADSTEILEVLFGLPEPGYTWESWIATTLAEEESHTANP